MDNYLMAQVAYVQAQTACAMIEAMGMRAENEACRAMNETPVYLKKDFDAVIEKYGIHHNATVDQLFRR